MATLKEAVESGRRWRYIHGNWREPASKDDFVEPTVGALLSSDFEIEPEPEKPREWWLCDHDGYLYVHKDYDIPQKSDGIKQFRVHDAEACERLRR